MPGGRRPSQHTESRKRAASRARTCATVVHQQFRLVLETGKPADRILAAFFRQNRKFGSTDRRLISALYFAVFRWWGWLQQILPDPTRPIDPHSPTGLAVLYGACLLDDVPAKSILPIWRDELKQGYDLPKDAPQRADSLAQSAKSLCRFFRLVPDSLQPRSLLPEWIWHNLPANCNHDRLLAICQQRPPLWLRGLQLERLLCIEVDGLKPRSIVGGFFGTNANLRRRILRRAPLGPPAPRRHRLQNLDLEPDRVPERRIFRRPLPHRRIFRRALWERGFFAETCRYGGFSARPCHNGGFFAVPLSAPSARVSSLELGVTDSKFSIWSQIEFWRVEVRGFF